MGGVSSRSYAVDNTPSLILAVNTRIGSPVGREPDSFVDGLTPLCCCIPSAMRIALLLMFAGIGACSAAAPEPKAAKRETCPPSTIKIALSASERSNATPEGSGRPVQLRVYQLQADTKLRGSTFEDIWQKDKEVLATDLKSVAEYTVFPGKPEEIVVTRGPDVNFLGLVALFREPKGTDWYLSYELPAARQSPPCAKAISVPVYLDKMHIQDGEGRPDEAGTPAGTSSTSEQASPAQKGVS